MAPAATQAAAAICTACCGTQNRVDVSADTFNCRNKKPAINTKKQNQDNSKGTTEGEGPGASGLSHGSEINKKKAV